jgi:hypothetical protein
MLMGLASCWGGGDFLMRVSYNVDQGYQPFGKTGRIERHILPG